MYTKAERHIERALSLLGGNVLSFGGPKRGQKRKADGDVYEVESIVDSREREGEIEYHIKWKGYPPSENTWEPEENLDCPKKLEAFRKRRNRQKEPNSYDDVYEVESIVDVREIEGEIEYLIKWKGYPPSENTWEPKQSLGGCKHIIKRFEKDKGKGKQSHNQESKRPAKEGDAMKHETASSTTQRRDGGILKSQLQDIETDLVTRGLVEKALSGQPYNQKAELLIRKFGCVIHRHNMWRLTYKGVWNGNPPWKEDSRGRVQTPDLWLDSEVINFYMGLLMNEAKKSTSTSFHLMHSNLFSKLIYGGYNYSGVSRWTTKDTRTNKNTLMQHFDKIIVPINHDMTHWGLAVIDTKEKCVVYCDSMGEDHFRNVTEKLIRWICDDHNDKVGMCAEEYGIPHVKAHPSDWRSWFGDENRKCPQQRNGYDCGVFACMFALHIIHDSKMLFSQTDINDCRRLIAHKILATPDFEERNETFFS